MIKTQKNMENTKLISWVLKIAVAGEFIGHGFLAIGGKADWIKWIVQLAGVSTPTATTLLSLVGYSDVLFAVVILIKPIRLVLLWMVFWGFWTALVRPLVGIGWLDFIERWANWGSPLALLLLVGWPKQWKEWFK